MDNEISFGPDSAPDLTLANSKFAGQLRIEILQGAQSFMQGVAQNLPGSNVENPQEKAKFLAPLIKEIAHRIMGAIEISKSKSENVVALRKAIVEAVRLNDNQTLFGGSSLSKVSLEELHKLANDEIYWRYRVSMAIRAEMLGLDGKDSLTSAFEKIIDNSETKELFKDDNGYRLASHLYSKGSMLLAHTQMSKFLKTKGTNLKSEMNWVAIPGSTREYAKAVEAVSTNFVKLRGIEGYTEFSDKYMFGRMQKAYQLVSAACKYNNHNFKALGWVQFQGSTAEFQSISHEICTNFFKPPAMEGSMTGLQGYKNFALKYFEGDMLRAHQIVSSVCKFKDLSFDTLGWSQFHGKVADFDSLSEVVRNKFDEFKGIEGYKKFALEYSDGKMQRSFIRVSAICKLCDLPFKELEWVQFVGTVSEFEKLGSDIKVNFKKVIEPGSFQPFLREHAQSIEQRLKQVAARLCIDAGLRADVAGWSIFSKVAGELQDRLKNFNWDNLKKGKISSALLGVEGQREFALEYTDGQMQKAFTIVSAFCTLEKIDFEELGWITFLGSTAQFDLIQEGINTLRERGQLDNLLSLDKSDRLPNLIRRISDLSPKYSKVLKSIEPANFYTAIPDKLSGQLSRQDLSVAYLRLDIDGESIYFDSGAERICGFILHKYGLIKKFVEGENLHVRANTINRISLDFYLEEKDLFIEYHPLSIGDLYNGVTLEQAGKRKIDSIQGGEYSHCRVIHIYDFDGLFEVLTGELGVNIPYAEFEDTLTEARSYGYECDRTRDNPE